MAKRYTVSDGKLVLNLEEAEEGGYIVTSPMDPELITEAETIEEVFAKARDASKALKQSRIRLMRHLAAAKPKDLVQNNFPDRAGHIQSDLYWVPLVVLHQCPRVPLKHHWWSTTSGTQNRQTGNLFRPRS